MSDQTPELNKALAAFQAEVPDVNKTKTAKVPTKNGGEYRYTYADLPDVMKAALPVLAKHGLSWTACPTMDESGAFFLEYALRHTSGEQVAGRYPLPLDGTPQALGSGITYARRYAFCSVIGIAADEDDDGKAASDTKVSRPERKKFDRPAPAQTDAAVVDLSGYIMANLDEWERQLLRDNWKHDYPNFPASKVPKDKEQECRTLIDSFVGTAPKAGG